MLFSKSFYRSEWPVTHYYQIHSRGAGLYRLMERINGDVELQNLLLIDKGKRKMLNAIQEGSSVGDVHRGISRATVQNRRVKSSLKSWPSSTGVSEDMGQFPCSKFCLKIVCRAVHFVSHALYKISRCIQAFFEHCKRT